MRGLYRGLREGVLLLGVLLLMTAAALAAAPVQQETMTTIVCMGDSLTDAEWKTHQDAASYSYLPAAEQHWTSLIAKELPAKVINKGIARQRTDEMLARFQKDVVAQQPEVCIIWGGANDVLQGKAVPSILRNVRYMIELCQQNNIRPVLVDAPIRLPDDPAKAEQCQRDFALLHEAYKKLAADEKLAFVDLYETKLHGTNGVPAMYTLPDGVHLNAIGQAVAAQQMLAVLRPVLASPAERPDAVLSTWVTAIQEQRQAGKAKTALQLANQALVKYPASAALYALRANLYIDASDIEKADQDLVKALKLDPACTEAYLAAGVIAAGEGDMQKAKDAFAHAVAIDPLNAEAWYAYAYYYDRGIADYPAAIAKLDQAVAMAGPEQRAEIEMQRLDTELAALDFSTQYLEKFIVDISGVMQHYTKPQSLQRGVLLFERAKLYKKKGDYLQAMLDVRAARSLFAGVPSLFAYTYVREAAILEAQGDEAGAAKAYRQAREQDPSTYIPYHYRPLIGGALH